MIARVRGCTVWVHRVGARVGARVCVHGRTPFGLLPAAEAEHANGVPELRHGRRRRELAARRGHVRQAAEGGRGGAEADGVRAAGEEKLGSEPRSRQGEAAIERKRRRQRRIEAPKPSLSRQ